MKKRQTKALVALLTFTLLFTTFLSGCGKDNTNANLQKVVLNDDAPFYSSFLWK